MLSADPVPTGSLRLPAIDRFRGIAILSVVLYHVSAMFIFPEGWGLGLGVRGKLVGLMFLPWHMGRVGVNLFFVISGLCIHMRLARQQASDQTGTLRGLPRHGADASFQYRAFFLRRFLRIYPTYWVVLAVGAAVAPIFAAAVPELRGAGIETSAGSVLLHAVMLHSFWKDTIMSIIRPLWSIATEEQFYLLYPLVFVILGRRLRITTIVGGLLLLSAVWRLGFVLTNPPPENFFSGPFLVWVFGFSLPRYFEWSLGALLAWALATQRPLAMVGGRFTAALGRRPWVVIALGLSLIVISNLTVTHPVLRWLVQDPLASFGWFLVMAAVLLPVPGTSRAASLPRTVEWAVRNGSRFLEAIGRRSYSIYLVHEMVLLAVMCVFRRQNLPLPLGAPIALALIWPVTAPFYRFVELPSEWRSKQVGRPAPALPARPVIPAVYIAARPTIDRSGQGLP